MQLTEERWKQLLMTEAMRGVQIAPVLFGAASCGTLWLHSARPSDTWIGTVVVLAVGLFWAIQVGRAIRGADQANTEWTRALEKAQRDGEEAARRAREEEVLKTEDIRIRAEERGRKEGREALREVWSDERIIAAMRLCSVGAFARVSHANADAVISYDTVFSCPFNATLAVERLTFMVGAHEIKSINVGREIAVSPGACGNHAPFVVELSADEATAIKLHATCEKHTTGSILVVGQIKCNWTPTALKWKGTYPVWVDIT